MPLPDISYYFEADVLVKAADWATFTSKYGADAGKQVVSLLDQQGIKLHHSMKTYKGDNPVYYNYWRLGPNINTLPDKQRKLSDNPFWSAFCNSIYKEEEKELILPLSNARCTEPGFQWNDAAYLRIQYDIAHFAVPEFRARLEESVASEGVRLGWRLGNSYLYLTGHEGRVVQIWLVPAALKQLPPGDVRGTIDGLAWMSPPQVFNKNILKEKLSGESSLSWGLYDRSEFDVDDPIGTANLG